MKTATAIQPPPVGNEDAAEAEMPKREPTAVAQLLERMRAEIDRAGQAMARAVETAERVEVEAQDRISAAKLRVALSTRPPPKART